MVPAGIREALSTEVGPRRKEMLDEVTAVPPLVVNHVYQKTGDWRPFATLFQPDFAEAAAESSVPRIVGTTSLVLVDLKRRR